MLKRTDADDVGTAERLPSSPGTNGHHDQSPPEHAKQDTAWPTPIERVQPPQPPAAPTGRDWLGGIGRSAQFWRVRVRLRLDALRTEAAQCETPPPGVAHALDTVEAALAAPRSPVSWFSGGHIEDAWRALHRAETLLIAASKNLVGHLPAIAARVGKHLPDNDLRRIAVQAIVKSPPETITEDHRTKVRIALAEAWEASDDAHTSLRSLRNLLMMFGGGLVLFNLVLGFVTSQNPALLPLCGNVGSKLTCATGGATPTGGDVWLLQGMGLLGAFLGVVIWLQRSDPKAVTYTLSVSQSMIKLALGAVLPVFAVLIVATGALQDLLSNRPALLVFAAAMGYAQEAATRVLDRYVRSMEERAKPTG
jgi:hypothetical protein